MNVSNFTRTTKNRKVTECRVDFIVYGGHNSILVSASDKSRPSITCDILLSYDEIERIFNHMAQIKAIYG